MANVPDLRSKEQITGEIIDGIKSRLRKDIDLADGSVLSQIIEAFSQGLFKGEADRITMIDALSIDRSQGEELQRKANDANVPIFSATASYGQVTITDATFNKITSAIYAGQPASVAGSLIIYVTNATSFSSSGGKIYIGRGSSNVEGPLTYTSTTPLSGGTYWAINLAATSPTTKFHNIGESVTLGQGGNRFIPNNTICQTPQGASITAVSFATTSGASIIDGEITVTNVPVRCNARGTIGNVAKGAIQEIVGVPFSATVYNSLAFANGRDADTEDNIKDRIKAYEAAKSKGTPQAIKLAAAGVVAKDELKKVASTSIVTYSDNSLDLVFDDNTGYEPLYNGVPFETVVDLAIGGEPQVQLRQIPVAQARVQSSNVGPFPVSNGDFLAVQVGNVETIHQFSSTDFKVPSSATAFEITASINGNSNLNFSATTASNGLKLVIYPRNRTANALLIKVPPAGIDANVVFGLPVNLTSTIRLYKNDQPLTQDGQIASLNTRSQASWSPAIAAGVTLIYSVDKTPAITATFTLSNFQLVSPIATVSYVTPISVWAQVMNNIMPGIIATVQGDQISIESNRGASSIASIEITGGTLLSQMFDTSVSLLSTGQTSDFTLNKNTGQIGFSTNLIVGDKVTAGSQYTRGNALTTAMATGPGVAGRVWMISDGACESIPNDVKSNTQVTFQKSGNLMTITGQTPSLTPDGFTQAQAGDWLVVWANPTDPAALQSNQGFWRIRTVQTGQITVDDGTIVRPSFGSFIPLSNRIVIVRSQAPIQLLNYPISSLVTFVNNANNQLVGITSQIVGSQVRISTETFDADGQIYFVAADQGGSALGLTLAKPYSNTPAHFGFVSQTDAEVSLPSFTHGILGAALSDKNYTQTNYEALQGQGDDFLEILNQYDPTLRIELVSSNKTQRSFVSKYDTALSTLFTIPPLYMDSPESVMNQGDRFFLRSSYKFDSNDSSIAIIDANAATESFKMPVARRLTVSSHSTPSTQDFSATDAESTLALNDPASFYTFNFADFKIHRQAKTLLTNGVYGLSMINADFGPGGNRVRIGLYYPDSILSTLLTSRFDVSEVIDAKIFLPVKTVRTPNWDYTSSFTVVKSTTGGADTLIYTYRSGLQPNFSNTGADVHIGDVAFLSSNGGFLAVNEGFQAQVIGITPTSFTLKLPKGSAVTDAVVFANIINQNGLITITTVGPHNLITGNSVGLYNTASDDGGVTYPFNQSYSATYISSTQFSVHTPLSVPGGSIQAAIQSSNIVTITSPTVHNLISGSIVLISNAGNPYDGLAAVSAVLSPYQFQYIKSGAGLPIASGRYDFQSFLPAAVASVTTITKAGYLVTANTSLAHGLSPGGIVSVAGVVINAWSNVVTYGVGDLVRYSGVNYVSLQAGNATQQPNISPAFWQISTLDLGGIFIVDSTPLTTQFTYYYQESGTAAGTAGTATNYVATGSMARSLGGATSANLQFASVQTTSQALTDYINVNLAGQIVAKIASGAPTAVIATSTADLNIVSNYTQTNVTGLYTFLSSRRAKLRTAAVLARGADIVLSGMTGLASGYNGSYVILDTYLDQGLGFIVSEIQLPTLATATQVLTPGGQATGVTNMQMLADGENAVMINDLSSLVTVPMFTAKKQWAIAPAIGEELRLVAATTDHLYRFWNQLVVTGFSNVGLVELTRYGRELQLSTQTFGGLGSVQVAGGTANSLNLALIGSTSLINAKLGAVSVPYVIRTGLMPRQWINLKNTVRQNKLLAFNNSTTVLVHGDGLEITAGSGTFQTQRSITHTANTELKLEKHGQFLAVIGISGPSMSLITNNIQEGDWVRITDINASSWVSSTTYSIGQRVLFGNNNYTSLQNSNLNNSPATTPLFWQLQEFNKANVGIFQVVRTFGQDSFWIKHDNTVEEILTLGNPLNMTFYDYESVMPGDTLVITTDSLGAANVGRYTVVDDSFGIGFSFPVPNRIWTKTIPTPPISAVVLGGEFTQVNIEEASPTNLWKKIFALGPGSSSLETVIVDSPNLVTKISSSLGGGIVGQGKLGFNQSVNFGIDGYKRYLGLIEELNKVIYGDPSDPTNYPGVRAGGTAIGITPAIIRRITASFSIRIKSGIPFSEIRDRVKSGIAGYVNNLDVGVSVSISNMIAAATSIPGVVSVAITFPVYSSASDLISVAANEKAFILDPTADITISLIS